MPKQQEGTYCARSNGGHLNHEFYIIQIMRHLELLGCGKTYPHTGPSRPLVRCHSRRPVLLSRRIIRRIFTRGLRDKVGTMSNAPRIEGSRVTAAFRSVPRWCAILALALAPAGAAAATTTTVVDVPTRGVTQRFLYVRPDAPIAIDARQGMRHARALVWVTGKRCAEQVASRQSQRR